MSLIFPRRMSARLKLALVVYLIALSLIAMRVAGEWGGYVGGALFDVLRAHQAMSADTRVIFEGAGALAAFVICAILIGWLWYRLIVLWRRVKAWIAHRYGPPALAHPQ